MLHFAQAAQGPDSRPRPQFTPQYEGNALLFASGPGEGGPAVGVRKDVDLAQHHVRRHALLVGVAPSGLRQEDDHVVGVEGAGHRGRERAAVRAGPAAVALPRGVADLPHAGVAHQGAGAVRRCPERAGGRVRRGGRLGLLLAAVPRTAFQHAALRELGADWV